MNLLDRLKQAEAKATPRPWSAFRVYATTAKDWRDEDAELILLLRNHAADLIRLVEAANAVMLQPIPSARTAPEIRLSVALAPFLAEEDAR